MLLHKARGPGVAGRLLSLLDGLDELDDDLDELEEPDESVVGRKRATGILDEPSVAGALAALAGGGGGGW